MSGIPGADGRQKQKAAGTCSSSAAVRTTTSQKATLSPRLVRLGGVQRVSV